ncbi:hypothetical protein LshimejAT787_0112220 [Lyophyllum shimeji]|uniref:Uncharacterized protein n=1 Tax=Lyophyllum shimeji TaxID=47721 RepID=A0A9P3PF78_LYOSH|nr:hypothetical protein LshimejAT787_0112220 [Lyophyllum shimeji]
MPREILRVVPHGEAVYETRKKFLSWTRWRGPGSSWRIGSLHLGFISCGASGAGPAVGIHVLKRTPYAATPRVGLPFPIAAPHQSNELLLTAKVEGFLP